MKFFTNDTKEFNALEKEFKKTAIYKKILMMYMFLILLLSAYGIPIIIDICTASEAEIAKYGDSPIIICCILTIGFLFTVATNNFLYIRVLKNKR